MLASFPTERLCIFEISDHFGYYLNTCNHDLFHYFSLLGISILICALDMDDLFVATYLLLVPLLADCQF